MVRAEQVGHDSDDQRPLMASHAGSSPHRATIAIGARRLRRGGVTVDRGRFADQDQLPRGRSSMVDIELTLDEGFEPWKASADELQSALSLTCVGVGFQKSAMGRDLWIHAADS